MEPSEPLEPLEPTGRGLREPFAEAVLVATDLVLRPEVAEAWSRESACADMSVGGLARHVVSQWFNAERLLRTAPGPEVISALDHYARAAWVTADHDDEANADIREGSEELAHEGVAAMRELIERLAGDLADVLASDRSGPVPIPWQGWSLSEDDFLLTRLMEIVVHSDDLAASVGLATPEFPDDVIAPVVALLTAIASRRHGQAAVVRALSRPQRAPASVSAF